MEQRNTPYNIYCLILFIPVSSGNKNNLIIIEIITKFESSRIKYNFDL